MGYPEDLLEQADFLSRRERTRPRQASLRRSVSTSYYAVFHMLIAEAVSLWKVPAHRAQLARVFEHGRMKSAAVRVVRMKYPDCDPRTVDHLRLVAGHFSQLYDDRQTADYDNAASWSRVEAQDRVRMATQAFQSWKAIRGSKLAEDFLLSLLVKER